jgi:hypothetical protein
MSGRHEWRLVGAHEEYQFEHSAMAHWPDLLPHVLDREGWTLADLGFDSEWELALFEVDFRLRAT